MHGFEKAPSILVCLGCASWVDRDESIQVRCLECGTIANVDALERLYRFSAETHYYGFQYRDYYERALARSKSPPKPSLLFDGELFAWVMLAILSGVIGNASYDLIRSVVKRMVEHAPQSMREGRDYSSLLELSDEELGRLIGIAQDYHDDLQGLTQEVRAAIVEEIVADTIAHDHTLAQELMRLMAKREVKPKHRKRFAQLIRHAMGARRQRQIETKPKRGSLNNLWKKLKD